MMGIFTLESLQGVAWILGGIWGVVKLVEIYFDHLDTIRWKQDDKNYEKMLKLKTQVEELIKERDMMRMHFFPDKTEVSTKSPAKKKVGRPRKK